MYQFTLKTQKSLKNIKKNCFLPPKRSQNTAFSSEITVLDGNYVAFKHDKIE